MLAPADRPCDLPVPAAGKASMDAYPNEAKAKSVDVALSMHISSMAVPSGYALASTQIHPFLLAAIPVQLS